MIRAKIKLPDHAGKRILFGMTLLGVSALLSVSILLEQYLLSIVVVCLPLAFMVAAYLVRHPHLAILVVLVSYMFRAQLEFGFLTSNIAMILLCVCSILSGQKGLHAIPSKSFVFWFLLYFGYITFSFYNSNERFDYYEINGFFNSFILLWIVFLFFDSKEKIELFYKFVIWSALGLVAMGFLQLIVDGMPRNGMTGFYSNHVVYALHIAWGIPLAFYFYKNYRDKRYFIAFLLLVVGILLAYSRGVLMAVTAAGVLGTLLVLWPSLSKRERLKYLSAVCFIGLIAVGVLWQLPEIIGQFDAQKARRFTSGRSILFQAAWEMFKEHPLLGAGWEEFRDTWSGYTDILRPRYGTFMGDKRLNVHSSYLKILAELGLVGLSLYLLFNFSLWRAVGRTSLSRMGAPLLIILLIHYFHGLVDNNSYGNERMFYFAAGLLFAIKGVTSRPEEMQDRNQGALTTAFPRGKGPPDA